MEKKADFFLTRLCWIKPRCWSRYFNWGVKVDGYGNAKNFHLFCGFPFELIVSFRTDCLECSVVLLGFKCVSSQVKY